MTPRELIEAFGTLAEAPDGVKRLRELVLQLAVRGKLVPQVEGEEPAGRLLERIAEERKKLVAAKLLSGQKPRGRVVHPDAGALAGWAEIQLGDVIDLEYGKSLPAHGRSDSGTVPVYGSNGPVGIHDEAMVPGPAIVVGRKGSAGAVNVVLTGFWPIDTTYYVVPRGGMGVAFTALLLQAARLDKLDRATAIPGLNREDAYAVTTWLPPLAEQHRIVAKVDELMAFLDKLEAAKTARDTTRKALRDAALAALREADSPDDVELAWGRIAEQMDELFAEPEDVAPLRQAVLQLAVRGRLVRQVEGDEPASTTLKRIAKTTYPDVGAADLLFPIPSNWAWCRMGNACDLVSGVAKGRKLSGGKVAERPYLRVANVQAGFLDLTVIKTIEATTDEVEQYRLQTGDVLLTEGGDWDKLGRSAIWGAEIDDCIHQNHIFRARCLQGGILPQWLSKFTNSADGRTYFQSCSKQTTNLASINMTQLRNCPVPVPPLAEQHRIVAKVDELMALLDKLEGRLRAAKTLQAAFAAAAVHHLEPEVAA